MKMSERYANLGRITLQGVAVVGLLMLAGAGIGNVQAAVAAGAATKTTSTTTVRPPAKGAHEGIGVHGHWIIDVKNPDGTLARHVEFENGLCTANGIPGSSGVPSGDQFLAALLAGSSVIGGWEIQLGNPSIPTGANPGLPCQVGSSLALMPSAEFILEQNNDGYTGANCPGTLTPTGFYCFPTLNPPTLGANNAAVILAAQFTVPGSVPSTQITAVGTSLHSCAATAQGLNGTVGVSPLNCLSNNVGENWAQFTGAYLTGVAPMPAAITVVAGQSVSVNVQLSFH
jgi:hypothetical protein